MTAKPADLIRQRLTVSQTDLTDALTLADTHTGDMLTPTSTHTDVHRRAAPASRTPSPGDLTVRHAYAAMTRHIARAHHHLDPGDGDSRHWRPTRVLGVPYDQARHVPLPELRVAVRTLQWLLAAWANTDLSALTARDRRRVEAACDEAHAALAAWDQPEHGRGDEAGTFLRPPAHWPGRNPRRCKRLLADTCKDVNGALMGKRRGNTCQACAQVEYRRRRSVG